MRIGKSTFSLMWPTALSSNETRVRRREDDERKRNENLPVPKRMFFLKRDMAKSARLQREFSESRNERGLSSPHLPVNAIQRDDNLPQPLDRPTNEGPGKDQLNFSTAHPAILLGQSAPIPLPEHAGVTEAIMPGLQAPVAGSNDGDALQQPGNKLSSEWPSELTQESDLNLLRHNLSLLENHRTTLIAKENDWLKAFQLLLNMDAEWTASNFKAIDELTSQELIHLSALLTQYEKWTKKNFDLVHGMDMEGLLLHLKNDFQWTEENLRRLSRMESIAGLVTWVNKDKSWTTQNIRALGQLEKSKLDNLTKLLEINEDWTIRNFRQLTRMDSAVLLLMPDFLRSQEKWVTDHINELKEMNSEAVQELAPLLESHRDWTISHFNDIKSFSSRALRILRRLLNERPDWTEANFESIKESFQDIRLVELLEKNTEWAMNSITLVQQMSHTTALMFWELYDLIKEDSRMLDAVDLEKLKAIQESAQDKELEARKFFLKITSHYSNGFAGAVNPFMREFEGIQKRPEDEQLLKLNGASRSTLAVLENKKAFVDSILADRFRRNHALLPDATFGVENEMYIPAIPGNSNEFSSNMNSLLLTKGYSYVDDMSLFPAYLARPTEQVSPILRSPTDIQELQNVISVINDWGGFTNQSTGVHIHTGVRQWKTTHCLKDVQVIEPDSKLAEWDMENKPDENITPLQFLAMKQFIINMASIQEDFFEISRESKFNQRNAPEAPNQLAGFYSEVSAAPDLESLIRVAQRHGRDSWINLHAFSRHGTIEIRGFTKKNSGSMGIDPNLPLRDIIFLQDVWIRTLNGMEDVLLSSSSSTKKYSVKPDESLNVVVREYIQDVYLLQIVHALGQREWGKRVKTMEAILKDKERINISTLQKVKANWKDLVEDASDRMAQHFFDVLQGKENWNPVFNGLVPIRRRRSLRSAADAVLKEGEEGK